MRWVWMLQPGHVKEAIAVAVHGRTLCRERHGVKGYFWNWAPWHARKEDYFEPFFSPSAGSAGAGSPLRPPRPVFCMMLNVP